MNETQEQQLFAYLQAGRFDEARQYLASLDPDDQEVQGWQQGIDELEKLPPGVITPEVFQALQEARDLKDQGREDEARERLIQSGVGPQIAAKMMQSQLGTILRAVSVRTSGGSVNLGDLVGGVLGGTAFGGTAFGGMMSGGTFTGQEITHTREGGTYEMLWDCQYCGATKLLGKTHRHCPVCGAAQDPQSRYFPSDEEKVAVEDHVHYGADLVCPACGSLNSANNQHCGNCGFSLADAPQAGTLESQVQHSSIAFESSGPRDIVKERYDAEMQRVGVQPKAGAGGRPNRWLIIGIIAAVVLGIAGAIFALTATREARVQVAGHSWERVIEIEEYQRVRDGGWCGSIPFDAVVTSRERRQSGVERIPAGEDCDTRRIDNGDGTFREVQECRTIYREEPIYDDWCSYTVNRWRYARSVDASGSGFDTTPVWPAYTLACTGERLGCERVSRQRERYEVLLREMNGGAEFTCTYDDEATWAGFGIETRWLMAVTQVGGAPRCDTLQRAP